MLRRVIICITVVAVLPVGYGSAIPPALAEPAGEKNCTDCHPKYAERLSGEYNHQPFADGNCESCHQYHGFRNDNELSGPIIDICTDCHAEIIELPEEMIHYPVAEERSCLECHLPHGADNKKFLTKPVKTICVECHDSPAEAAGIVHQPYADSACVDCHNPHGSLFSSSLVLPTGYVCLTCHDDVIPDNNPAAMHTGDEIASCEHCHRGHFSEIEKLLPANVNSLCAGCHVEVKQVLKQGKPHSVLLDNNCLACHTPHFRKGGSSLIGVSPALCYTCHGMIKDRTDLEHVHAPVSDGCATCHDAHARFDPGTEPELCANCHDAEESDFLVQHLNRRPSACSGCHDPHGSATASLIRAVEHPPFADRECEICHEPGPGQLKLKSPELCLNCHDDLEPSPAHRELQPAEQDCIACHSPHAGNRNYLVRPTRAVSKTSDTGQHKSPPSPESGNLR